MKKIFICLTIIALVISCQSNQQEVSTTQSEGQTPQTLSTDEGTPPTYNQRGYNSNDIIERLYLEALRKDEALQAINGRIGSISKVKSEKLKDYKVYVDNNNSYWTAVETYLRQIQDTTLRQGLSTLFDDFKEDHLAQTSELNTLSKSIKVSTSVLSDKELIMKLLVTQPMMRNYQRNELPKTAPLQMVKGTYDSLITEIKPYSEFVKQN